MVISLSDLETKIGEADENLDRLNDAVNGASGNFTDSSGNPVANLNKRLEDVGYLTPVDFASGLNVTDASFTVIYNEETYNANPASIPFITTATFDPSQWVRPVIIEEAEAARDAAQASETAASGHETASASNATIASNAATVASEAAGFDEVEATKAAGDAAASGYADGALVLIITDETRGNASTIYREDTDALVFVRYWTRERILYVDSVNGLDTNDALTPSTAVLTLSKAVSLMRDGEVLRLVGGSGWREKLDVSSLEGCVIECTGGGAKPWISARDVQSSFTQVGSTSVYKFDVTYPAVDPQRGYPAIFEDGVRLEEYLDTDLTATDETTIGAELPAGAFFFAGPGDYDAGWSAGTKTYYVRASDSGNPASNGKTYEFPNRDYAFEPGANLLRDFNYVYGLSHNGLPKGPASGPAAELVNLMGFDPARHGTLLTNAVLTGCSVVGHNPLRGGGSFHSNPEALAQNITWRNLKAIGGPRTALNAGRQAHGFYTHGGFGGPSIREKTTLIDCYGEGVANLTEFTDTDELVCIRLKGRDCASLNGEDSADIQTYYALDFIGGLGVDAVSRPILSAPATTHKFLAGSYVDVFAQQLVFGNTGIGKIIAEDSTLIMRPAAKAGNEAYFFIANGSTDIGEIDIKRCVLICAGAKGLDDFVRCGVLTTINVDETLIIGNHNEDPVLRITGGDVGLSTRNGAGNRVLQISETRAIQRASDGKLSIKRGAYEPGADIYFGAASSPGATQPRTSILVGDKIAQQNASVSPNDSAFRLVYTPTEILRAVAFCADTTTSDSRFIAVGDNGLILRSTNNDGDDWEVVGAGITSEDLLAVHSAGAVDTGEVVAVGTNGAVLLSTDYGATWATATTPGTTRTMRGVASDGTSWLACGDEGRVITSSDGDVWAETTQDSDVNYYAAFYSTLLSTWMIGGDENSTADAELRTSTDLSTWTQRAVGTRNRIVAFGENDTLDTLLIAFYQIEQDDATFAYSDDGATWTISEETVPFQVNDLAHGGEGNQYIRQGYIAAGESQYVGISQAGTGPWALKETLNPETIGQMVNPTYDAAFAENTHL